MKSFKIIVILFFVLLPALLAAQQSNTSEGARVGVLEVPLYHLPESLQRKAAENPNGLVDEKDVSPDDIKAIQSEKTRKTPSSSTPAAVES